MKEGGKLENVWLRRAMKGIVSYCIIQITSLGRSWVRVP